MKSKKEIENMKDDLRNLHHMLGKEPSISKKAIENALQYIEELETDKQKLIEKLEGDIEALNFLHDNYIDANVQEGTYETLGRINYAQEILKIVKGESNE